MTARLPSRLPDAGWLRTPPTSDVLATLNGSGATTRVVGGAVRNALMGLPPGDLDLATTAAPADVMTRASAAGMKAIPTGIDHGTVTVVAANVAFEVTTLRRDVETHGRRATVVFDADWEADARRRDFTMNALYADPDGRLHDPLDGYGDLVARRVRFIDEPRARIREDYLRILRFFRFHAEYGRGEPDRAGLVAAVEERLGLLRLSGERVRQEMLRLLVAPGASGAIEAMSDAGLMQIVLGGIAYRAAFDTASRLDVDGADAVTRLAALAVWLPEDALRLAARLRLSAAERNRLIAAGEGWWRLSPRLSPTARRVWLYRLGRAVYRERVLLAWARCGEPDDAAWRELFNLPDVWEIPLFPLRGGDLVDAGLARGPAVGEMLARLEAQWIADGFAEGREALMRRARALSRGRSADGAA